MSLTYNAKILLKYGSGDPGTNLDLGEPGFDASNGKFYIGNGIGNTPISLLTSAEYDPSSLLFVKESSLGFGFTYDTSKFEVDSSIFLLRDDYNQDTEILNNLRQAQIDSGEPTGFVDTKNDSSLYSVNDVIYISAIDSSFGVYVKGTKFNIIDSSITIPHYEGFHYISFDSSGLLSDSSTLILHPENATAVFVYWDNESNDIIWESDQRHGMVMDGATHRYLHYVNGVQLVTGFQPYGFTYNEISEGDTDAEAQFSLTPGIMFDEDISHTVSTLDMTLSPLTTHIYWIKDDGLLRKTAPTSMFVKPFEGGDGLASYAKYDDISKTYTQTEVQNGWYINSYIVYVDDFLYPVICIQGFNEYETVEEARTNSMSDIQIVMQRHPSWPTNEWKAICSIIYKSTTSFTNSVKSIIAKTDTGLDFVDVRNISLRTTGLTSHNTLLDLKTDTHKQYTLLDGRQGDILNIDSIKGRGQSEIYFNNNLLKEIQLPSDSSDATNKWYVDQNNIIRDLSINNLKSYNIIQDISINYLDSSIKDLYSLNEDYISKTYVDGSLVTRDQSINWLYNNTPSGTGVNNKVAIWNSTTGLTYDTNLSYNPTNNALAIGPINQDASNPAPLLIDAGLAQSINAVIITGNIDDYYQINIKNQNGGNTASSDIVATASNGDEEVNYINLGINSPAYNGGFGGGPNDAYLLSTGENLIISNISNKDIIFSTNGEDSYLNEKARITTDGSVLIGKPTSQKYLLEVNGDINVPLGNTFRINGEDIGIVTVNRDYVDGSLANKTSFTYVDGSLAIRDNSINWIFDNFSNYLLESSLGTDFYWNGNVIDLSTAFKNKINNSSSEGYQPFYYKNSEVNTNFLRTLKPVNGLIVYGDGSTSTLDASIFIPSSIEITNKDFQGNLNQTFQRLFFVDKSIREKTSNIFSEAVASGATQLAANIDADSSQGLWMPWGSTTWDPSSSIIEWSNWLLYYNNTQTVIRSSFTFDVSNLSNNSYSVYFNNSSGTPILDISTELNRKYYPDKCYIGHITVLNGNVGYWHETPDVFGTPIIDRDVYSFGLSDINGIVLSVNNDASTLNVSSGTYILEGANFRNIDYYNNSFIGSQHIVSQNAISKPLYTEIDPSTGYINHEFGSYQSLLTSANRYYDISTNSILTYTGIEKFVLSGVYLLDNNSVTIRRGKLYDTLNDAITDIPLFNQNSSPISSVIRQIHPLLGYFIIATDCSTLLDPTLFSIQNTNVGGSTTGSGGGGTGILGATNIGLGQGIYTNVTNDLIQLKSLISGNTNSIKITSNSDTIIFDASIRNYDTSVNDLYHIKTDKTYTNIQDVSILELDASVKVLFELPSNYVSLTYVDGSLFSRDASISDLYSNKTSKLYVDGSLAVRDASISELYDIKANKSEYASLLYVDSSLSVRDSSISELYNIKANTSLLSSYTTKIYVDGSLSKRDVSIIDIYNKLDLTASLLYVDGSLSIRDASINLLRTSKADIIYVDGSLSVRDASIVDLKLKDTQIDASIDEIILKNDQQDASINTLFNTLGGVYGTEFQIAQDLTLTTTSATTPQPKVTMTTTNLPSGTYKISSGWIWNHSATNTDMLANITLNGTPLGTTSTINIEISDTTTWQTAARFFYATLSGVNTIVLNYWNENGSTSISDATIELIRVS